MERGSYRITQSKAEPRMIAVSWVDSRPVYFIATGCSTLPATMSRRAGAEVVNVPGPELVKVYQDGMRGADVHDQLRLQRYSIEGVMKMRKYCHTIFLGMVDMALINAYIIYRRVQSERRRASTTHAEFMRAADFEGDLSVETLAETPVPPSPTPRYMPPGRHTTKQVDVFRTTRAKNGQETKNRRQYGCKVCSLLQPGKPRGKQHFTASSVLQRGQEKEREVVVLTPEWRYIFVKRCGNTIRTGRRTQPLVARYGTIFGEVVQAFL
ncbi:hypothetical protein F444_23030 [Phytophthora nicotianae P1976]|uniref:PiggyBac transposable element-derived protein domain-containing protein n=1 Tax=Phytophthora nicotianae P1976 TaxID=1317066 RepID=A0A080YW31_PHYNI|nr:hypothetical protein F444_23030 [Phytophthora nicotianae P1976]